MTVMTASLAAIYRNKDITVIGLVTEDKSLQENRLNSLEIFIVLEGTN